MLHSLSKVAWKMSFLAFSCALNFYYFVLNFALNFEYFFFVERIRFRLEFLGNERKPEFNPGNLLGKMRPILPSILSIASLRT